MHEVKVENHVTSDLLSMYMYVINCNVFGAKCVLVCHKHNVGQNLQ